MSWVKVSERLPDVDDTDDDGHVWLSNTKIVWEGHYLNARHYPYWMAKPRQELPEPPKPEGNGP